MTDSLDVRAPVDGSSLIGRISRRRLIQGGVATGVALSVPMLPLPSVAEEREVVVSRLPLDLALATPAAAPTVASVAAGGSVSSLSAAASTHRLLPVVEPGEFRMVGLSWTGGPTTGAVGRVRHAGTWSGWISLDPDPSEGPDPHEAPPGDRRVSRGAWVDRADAIEVIVPDGIADLELIRVEETDRPAIALAEPTAGAVPGILPRSAWNARPPTSAPPITNDVRLAIVHHSADPTPVNPGDVAARIRSMQNYHIDGQGWSDIAYNFLVDSWGRIWEGRAGGVDKGVIGGHTHGCNTGTIGVCFVGTLTSSNRLPAAAEQAITALLSWKFNQIHAIGPGGSAFYAPVSANSGSRYAVGQVGIHPTVVGHQHFSYTACPGDASPPGRIHSALTRVSDVRGVSPAAGGAWDGFWRVSGNGQAHPHGWTAFYGSMAGAGLTAPMISLTPTKTGNGYWMLGADGGIFTFGDAAFHGSTGAMRLNKPVVGMARTASGNGYWLVAADGGIFSFGDAAFYGSTGGMWLYQPIIGMVATPSGRGYWLFASDGGIFTFGDAGFFGSGGGAPLPAPAVGVAAPPNGRGYWLALANGTVRAFGTAPHHGSTSVPSTDPIVGIAATVDGGGYWLAARSGKVFSFGNAT